jgi:hypothetical protein
MHDLPPPVSIPAPASASSEELRWVIEAALAARSGFYATIEITYRPGTVSIRCVEQQTTKARYDRWIQLLSSEIQKNAAQLAMGLARPPAPPAPPPPGSSSQGDAHD